MFKYSYNELVDYISNFDAADYAKTRNHLSGGVSRLSPYITHGIITLPGVRDLVLRRYRPSQVKKFLQELAWREYFQNVFAARKGDIFSDLRFDQPNKEREGIPAALINAETDITVIDQAVIELYNTGYMHNHARMWVASLATNFARCGWWQPAQWLYYHLLDGDLASNTLSWQWVCGAFASKQYTMNQDLINNCSAQQQGHTWLTGDVQQILQSGIPQQLSKIVQWRPEVYIPKSDKVHLDPQKPLYIYHLWHLDPLWHKDAEANRVMIIRPSHLRGFAQSQKVLDWIINTGKKMIPDLQIFVGEFSDFPDQDLLRNAVTRSHTAFDGFTGETESPPKLYPEISGYNKNFFSFWKKVEKRGIV